MGRGRARGNFLMRFFYFKGEFKMTNLLNAQWNNGYGLEKIQKGVQGMNLMGDTVYGRVEQK
jgi:hypothetical protein